MQQIKRSEILKISCPFQSKEGSTQQQLCQITKFNQTSPNKTIISYNSIRLKRKRDKEEFMKIALLLLYQKSKIETIYQPKQWQQNASINYWRSQNNKPNQFQYKIPIIQYNHTTKSSISRSMARWPENNITTTLIRLETKC